MNHFASFDRIIIRSLLVAAFGLTALVVTPANVFAQHDAHAGTPEATWSCDSVATPPAGHEVHSGDEDDTDRANHPEAEFDQLYIDMMLPHHGSIIALAEAALPHLTDARLQEMARNIIETQTAENAQLIEWRTEWFGSGEPATDEAMMGLMLEAMPVGTMDEMMLQMESASQVAMFCAAENPDLAFIEQTIPHHQMAIDASAVALEEAEHPELIAFAEDVIAAQQTEIDLLNQILAEIEGVATPAS
jgi:uncharacterized protein (DUF305 family)